MFNVCWYFFFMVYYFNLACISKQKLYINYIQRCRNFWYVLILFRIYFEFRYWFFDIFLFYLNFIYKLSLPAVNRLSVKYFCISEIVYARNDKSCSVFKSKKIFRNMFWVLKATAASTSKKKTKFIMNAQIIQTPKWQDFDAFFLQLSIDLYGHICTKTVKRIYIAKHSQQSKIYHFK